MHYDLKQSGEYIRSLRMQKRYTQENLSELLNVDRSFLSHIESGKKGCSIDLLVEIANIFDVSLDELVTGHPRFDLSAVENKEQFKKEILKIISCLETLKAYL